ncbi:MAG TPA: DUF1343 domain-containing protein [Pyrinomonadaceae bacterium]|jgi:uncharacterized protein YbbC (DUF1343 family)|nr:DUF1343 domain-containing protein [Pyrinomonadaceae bacterium]
MRTRLGVERLLNEQVDILRGSRVGLVCNPASVLPDSFVHVADAFEANDAINVTAYFGPQHGIRGDVQYNMIETPHVRDERTGKMVYSLYSETRVPTEEMVRDIDTFVVDLQDVGCRIYTYTYTMANCMIAAAKYGKRVVVCDRPNPITGVAVEGNVTETEFTSFVGQFELPTRPGMTIGEMAKMFKGHFGIDCELDVVEMDGWKREMWGDETGLPWILPSPNIPTVDTCVVFPATVHLEGTELSEGRGTTLPFHLNGAPYIDAPAWAEALNGFGFPGVKFRHAYFEPSFSEFTGQTCAGVQIHVTDRKAFTPVIVGIAMVKTAYEMYRDDFQWRQNAYEYEFDKNPFDVVCGTDKIRKAIEAGESIDSIQSFAADGLDAFKQLREHYLLY